MSTVMQGFETKLLSRDDTQTAILPAVHPVIRALRAVRVTIHVLRGIATTALVFPLASPVRRRSLTRRWSRKLLSILDIEVRVSGELEGHDARLLLVSNHVSWLDIFVLNAHRPARFVAKAELARMPFAGKLIRGAGTIFVERERRHDTRRVNHDAAHVLAAGDVVAVFPEGTTTDGSTVMKFHGSLLQPIVDAGGHVLPVGLRYRDVHGNRSTVPAYYGDDTFAASFWRVCGGRKLAVDVIAMPPLPAREKHRRELAQDARQSIRTALASPVPAREPGRAGGRAA